MRINKITVLSLILCASLLTGCDNSSQSDPSGEGGASQSSAFSSGVSAQSSSDPSTESDIPADTSGAGESGTTSEPSMTEGLSPVAASSLKNGEYDIDVDSSSSMFKITDCRLTVSESGMTAVMTMSGTGYLYLFMGTGDQAAGNESAYIPFSENADGTHSFTVPVEALNTEIACAAFSKNKEKWYDRTLVFRADSLPAEAFAENIFTTPADLGLADGEYTIEVTLEGGSGKVTVTSPTRLIIKDGAATAEVEFSSSKYDYMKVNDTRYDMINTEGNSKFLIPVSGFDYKMPVSADTTAMSAPHEIEYTLFFDSGTIK